MHVIVIIALVMAVICNICVLFRFLERWIWHNVILSLITATLQGRYIEGANLLARNEVYLMAADPFSRL